MYDGLRVAVKKAQSEGHSISAEDQAEFLKTQEGVQKQVLERYVQLKALKGTTGRKCREGGLQVLQMDSA